MKVCIITPTLFPEPGGPSAFVDNFIKSLRKDGHEISVIAIGESDEYLDKGRGHRVIKISRNRFLPLRLLITVFYILKFGWKSDLLFSCGLFLESAVSKFLIQKPLVIRIGGDPVWERWTNQEGLKLDLIEFHKNRCSPKIEILKALQRISCRLANRVIANSQFMKTVIDHWGIPQEKIEVIYNGINEEDLCLPAEEELKKRFYPQGGGNVLAVGRLIEFKRFNEIIIAFSWLINDKLNLIIIGDGPKRKQLFEIAEKLNIKNRVYFLGIKSHREVLQYLKASDLLVLNSVDEVMPNIILESIAIGTPVVAPAGGGVPEIITHEVDGLLYPLKKENTIELKQSIEKILENDTLRKEIIQNGLKKVNQFRWENSYEQTLNLIRSIDNRE